jgi:hypothetical protein
MKPTAFRAGRYADALRDLGTLCTGISIELLCRKLSVMPNKVMHLLLVPCTADGCR